MTLDALRAALADRYLIERELGAGGMATVYLAHDLKHDRKVAIKVLRPELAAVIGAERFLSEIKTTANLQHPHILPLFDSGVAGSFLFYVMPYVQGESLRDRITREHQLPVADAVRLATEIAGALDYAHRQGVIHRDIKPENVMLHDGQALVADFGIALAMANTAGTRMTETGMSLGTPHYMSPEQAMGEREITGRSDVYALGAITYEMLCGEPPFTGPTAQSIIARVMTEEPRGLTAQRKSVPPGVEAAVFTALEKLPADRYASAAEFAAALKDERATTRHTAAAPAAGARRARWIPAAVAGVAMLAVGLLLGRGLAPTPAPAALVRATLELGDSVSIRPISDVRLAIAPGGERVVFVGSDGDDAALWVRDLNAPRARRLDGTTGAAAPFFSPDGQSIGFFANGRMQVVAVAGGAIRTVVTDSVSTFGASWADDNQIYFSDASRGLSRVSAVGGPITKVAQADSSAGILELDYPDVLPGSKQAFVMLWKGSINSNRVGVIDLETGAVTELADGSFPRYLAPDRIAIGGPNGQLLVAEYDAKARRLLAPPVVRLDDVQSENANGTVQFAVARNGTLVYQRQTEVDAGLTWVDRAGEITPFDTTLVGSFLNLALSPDARQLALAVSQPRGPEVWVKQLTTGAFSRLSLELLNADRPVWSPDGGQVAFLGSANGRRTAWIRRADGSDSARMIDPSGAAYDEVALSTDGRYTVFRTEGSAVGTRDLVVREEGVDSVPRTLINSRYDTYAMVLSPNGRWIAYVSDEFGRAEVFVRPFPNVDSAKFAISTSGGIEPIWRRDGRELFYRDLRGGVYAVTIGDGPVFEHSAPTRLFIRPEMSVATYFRAWDVHPDGNRFLMRRTGGGGGTSLAVLLNWPQSGGSRGATP